MKEIPILKEERMKFGLKTLSNALKKIIKNKEMKKCKETMCICDYDTNWRITLEKIYIKK